jgi:hypothetical protein
MNHYLAKDLAADTERRMFLERRDDPLWEDIEYSYIDILVVRKKITFAREPKQRTGD